MFDDSAVFNNTYRSKFGDDNVDVNARLMSLTDEQQEVLDADRDHLIDKVINLSVEDIPFIERSMNNIFSYFLKVEKPKEIIWCAGPTETLAASAWLQRNRMLFEDLLVQFKQDFSWTVADTNSDRGKRENISSQLENLFFDKGETTDSKNPNSLAQLQSKITMQKFVPDGVIARDSILQSIRIRNAQVCNFWIHNDDTNVILACMPSISRKQDEKNRLHNEDGPAWVWADGTEIHSREGTRIPQWALNMEKHIRQL